MKGSRYLKKLGENVEARLLRAYLYDLPENSAARQAQIKYVEENISRIINDFECGILTEEDATFSMVGLLN